MAAAKQPWGCLVSFFKLLVENPEPKESAVPDDLPKSARKLFHHLGQNPGTWVQSAERLKKAADGLRQWAWPPDRAKHKDEAAAADFMIGPVYLMLMGFAVENVLKALVIAREPENIEQQRLSKVFCKHDLSGFWDRLGLRRCAEYDRALKRLETVAVSFGRYPVTKLKRNMDSMLGAGFHGEADFQAMERLWSFLHREFTKSSPDIPFDA